MSAVDLPNGVRPLQRVEAPRLAEILEDDFGRGQGGVRHQFLLDALDRGEYERFLVSHESEPLGVLYVPPSSAVVAAGGPGAGTPLAEAIERVAWRVLIGDAAVCRPMLDAYAAPLFRRRPAAREQRFMVAERPNRAGIAAGFRRGLPRDVERVTDLACLLHVEDRMGPPLSRSGRSAVRARMLDSLARGHTWVVERHGQLVAKADLSLHSRRRGSQIAGVYVDAAWRGQGIAAGIIGTLTEQLRADGIPAVTLHVRADNVPAIRAYTRAGFVDRAAWVLAFR